MSVGQQLGLALPATRGQATSGEGEPRLFDLPLSRPYVRWSKDSAAIYFIGGTSNASTIWRQTLTGGEPQKLIDFPDRIFNFAWSADGVNLVVARGKLSGDAILMTNLP